MPTIHRRLAFRFFFWTAKKRDFINQVSTNPRTDLDKPVECSINEPQLQTHNGPKALKVPHPVFTNASVTHPSCVPFASRAINHTFDHGTIYKTTMNKEKKNTHTHS